MNPSTPWGLMGPDGLVAARRVRTLDVGAAVRQFNELAVPGMGSIWTGRQLLWPLLGIAAAAKARESIQVSNIEAANAVEALACRMALATLERQRKARSSGAQRRDARIRGAQKLQDANNLTFQVMRRPGFYVTQPMRMSAVQPLLALGLVDSNSERFNAYCVSEAGEALLEAACAPYPACWHGSGLIDTLAKWMVGSPVRVAHIATIERAITPLAPLPPRASEVLRERLSARSDANSIRRRAALAWVRRLQDEPTSGWDVHAPEEFSPEHWADLHAGASFFRARDAALAVLDACERVMGPAGHALRLTAPPPTTVGRALAAAQAAAEQFLTGAEHGNYHPAGLQFCREIARGEHQQVLAQLVARDGRVLRLSDAEIVPGMAFDGAAGEESEEQDGDEATAVLSDRILLPAGMSFRMRNLFLMELDLEARLDQWLGEAETAA
ncbi:hypothetical protein KGA65_04330 [Ideonella sp. B7]|uniref:hypothetical protein n=1 Tax=Ideonella benzenivorans TaxID=2831643 RepID=UPI001CEDC0C0|nr:hypothetical protein [Ideonella benzenivorans]MCA6215768.1 hypothetical protein [Ideonella benzenivorans]